MKKFIKIAAKFAAVYTFAEFITMWRMQPQPVPFREFLAEYLKKSPAGYKQSYMAGQALAKGDPTTKKQIKSILFDEIP